MERPNVYVTEYTVGLDLSTLNTFALHMVIADLSPNRRWYCGTRGSYKRAIALGIPRSALPTLIAYCWNAVARARCDQDSNGYAVYGMICDSLYENLPTDLQWK